MLVHNMTIYLWPKGGSCNGTLRFTVSLLQSATATQTHTRTPHHPHFHPHQMIHVWIALWLAVLRASANQLAEVFSLSLHIAHFSLRVS